MFFSVVPVLLYFTNFISVLFIYCLPRSTGALPRSNVSCVALREHVHYTTDDAQENYGQLKAALQASRYRVPPVKWTYHVGMSHNGQSIHYKYLLLYHTVQLISITIPPGLSGQIISDFMGIAWLLYLHFTEDPHETEY